MDVAHAILFAKTIDISRVTADYSSAKFELIILKDVKAWLEDDGKPNSGLLFLMRIILETDMFNYVRLITSSRYIV